MKRALFITYLLAVHAALGLAAWRLTHHEDFGERMHGIYRSVDATIPDGSPVFIGDSITQRMNVAAVAPNAVNLGIGSQTTSALAERVADYRSLRRASAIYLLIGANDLMHRQPDFRRLLNRLPKGVPLVWSGIMPSKHYDPSATNARIRVLCAARPRCRYVDTSSLRVPDDFVDGLHPNARGYRKWVGAIRTQPSPRR